MPINQYKNKKQLIYKIDETENYQYYCDTILSIIEYNIKIMYQYNDNSYWLDMFNHIDKYMVIATDKDKDRLNKIIYSAKKDYPKYLSEIMNLIEHINLRYEKYSKKAKIFDCKTASQYIPNNNKTIMIRLMDSNHLYEDTPNEFIKFPNIINNDKYFKIIEIFVDDIDKIKYEDEYFKQINENKTIIPMNMDIAKDLLNEIDSISNGELSNYDLVTHCRLGKSRSTATFIALNEIYNLGYKNLKNIHNHYNHQIYNQLIEARNIMVMEKEVQN